MGVGSERRVGFRGRKAQNPKTLERVQMPAKRKVKFKAGRVMKQKVEKSGTGK
ncbi:MAG: HU family DNA-binding protein [Planctomycetota bacterium]